MITIDDYASLFGLASDLLIGIDVSQLTATN